MSGHSKWATIKHQKGETDQKRGQVFTKLAQSITLAVLQGGGSGKPDENFKLRLSIEKAKQANMPKDNIERAILRALENKGAQSLSEVLYEGYGPSGIAVVVSAATDNHARTFSEIKSTFDKNGGNLAGQGAVSYMFEQKGVLLVSLEGKLKEDIELIAIDCGCEDIEEANDSVLIYTKPHELMRIKKLLEEKNLTVLDAELIMKPTVTVQISDVTTASRILKFIDLLENTTDVQKVYSNFDIPDTILSQISF
jgi:YebC/PmpR family DNA-binding regulatory protein